jgi:predicted glycogen debranching enzyme
MIALPGLCLGTGRADEAARILRGFARYVRDGLIPNDFPDRAGVDPGYHTVDGSLWYVHAVAAYERATGDHRLVDDLLPTLLEIVECHAAGTRFGIEMDTADGLLRAGESGYQLTWMDAKAGDWVVTPRMGKPVEIQALWHEALCALTESMEARGEAAAAERYAAMADRVQASFCERFVRPGIDHLLDVVDGPDGDEDRLRPNQLLAASLPHPLVDGEIARGVLRSVDRSLRTSCGLRSLAPDDPGYRGRYRGDRVTRDAAYHEGTVWTWPVGAYAEATWRVTGDRAAALAILVPFRDHLADAGLGSISEILEGDPPHAPRGCTHQAWGVSELLRAWRLISGE